jgi:phage N-6-adenine-methyltransferase
MTRFRSELPMSDQYTYRVSWSEEDGEFVGTCAEFPSLSHLAADRDEALRGIKELVTDSAANIGSHCGMSAVTKYIESGAIVQFDPGATRTAQAKLDALIDYAGKMKDWPLLEQAVDAKMAEQAEFVRWWDENVRRKGGERWIDPAERGNQGMALDEAQKRTLISNQQVSRWRKSLEAADKYREKLIQAAYRKAGLEPEENHRAEGTGENEWYTPAQYVAMAREVLGGVDLDPASSAIANQTVRATNFFSVNDDGLGKSWFGKVWLNPPYAQPWIARFIDKLVNEVREGRVEKAIALTHNYTDTAWFQTAANAATSICFTRGRIAFLSPDGEKAAPTQGQAFFYFGNEPDVFADVFTPIGFVVPRSETA